MGRTISQQFSFLLNKFPGFIVWVDAPSASGLAAGLRVRVLDVDDDSFIGKIGESGEGTVEEFRFDSVGRWRVVFLPPLKEKLDTSKLFAEVPILKHSTNLITAGDEHA